MRCSFILVHLVHILRRFPFNKNSKNSEMGKFGTEISQKSVQKVRKLLSFRKAYYSNENSGTFLEENQWNGKFR